MAGVLAAAVLALWFFAIDLIRGRPLYTPAFMASALLGRDTTESSILLIAGYSILHFVSFAVVGIMVGWLLERSGIRPHLVLGAVLGFLLFDLVFYVGVIRGGANMVNRLGWPQVLAGNLLAGLVLMAYLRVRAEFTTMSWRERFSTQRVLREAVVSGLIGALVIVLWFFVHDLVRGRVFFTPAALGSVLFLGARSAAEVRVTFGTVFGYTIIHFAAFLLAGFMAAALLKQAERHPPVLLGIVLLFVTFEVLFFGVLVIVANWLLGVLESWTILASNAMAAAAMGFYLLRKHPALRAELNKPLEEDEQLTR
ncbi:MAG: hypothetical protein ACRENP_21680 [Longimicrobiales bacterium]